jgi:cell fate regulator YaaT (PSP1 superfamily)
MPQTVEVRFKGTRRDFFLWPDEQEPLRLREAVVVALDRGQDLGRVHTAGAAAEAKCGGGCTACAIGEGIAEARNGGRAAEPAETTEPTETAETDRTRRVIDETGAPRPDESTDPPASSTTPAPPTLRAVLRRATQEDVRVANDLRRSEEDARRQILQKVRQHRLEMKVSDTEWQWDRAKLTVYFTAEKRVDFRALVRDLAAQFRTRIELRQIGVRDEAARLTGVGRCGREYCCSTWLKELSPVSLALAKDQHLSLNPAQISGGCGRLLCCLKYEHEFYVAARKRFPREGKTLDTAVGREKVVAVDIFRERVFLRSEEHGPRIIPLVQLREELETSATGAREIPASSPAAVPAQPPRAGAPDASRQHSRTRPGRSPDSVGRRHDRTPRQPGDAPAPPPAPAAEPSPPDASAAPPTPPGGEATRRRRRRRGRRGRGGSGGPPGSTPPAEG